MNPKTKYYRDMAHDLLYILETVQWLGFDDNQDPRCPYCQESAEDGHNDDCIIHIALEEYQP